MMKTSLDPMLDHKQRELSRVLDILHEEFEDSLKSGAAYSRAFSLAPMPKAAGWTSRIR
jgi:hypothetical protein